MEEVRYMDLFSFVYSPRPGTKAAELTEEIGREEKLKRLERLQELQRRITAEIHETFRGSIQTVLIEGEGKLPGQVSGKTESGRTVNLAGEHSLIGTFADVRIIEVYRNSLLGELTQHRES
jgi:tRNA-2-methylthio-N6-dimethylallyladenosine synthase